MEGNPQVAKEQTEKVSYQKIAEIQKDCLLEVGSALRAVFNTQKEIEKMLGFGGVQVEYSVSHSEGDSVVFARFKIRKALSTLEHTILFNIWHDFAGFESVQEDVERSCRRLIQNVKNWNA